MERISHEKYNIEWDVFTAEDIRNTSPEIIAERLNRFSKKAAVEGFLNSMYQITIDGMGGDSVEDMRKHASVDPLCESLDA